MIVSGKKTPYREILGTTQVTPQNAAMLYKQYHL